MTRDGPALLRDALARVAAKTAHPLEVRIAGDDLWRPEHLVVLGRAFEELAVCFALADRDAVRGRVDDCGARIDLDRGAERQDCLARLARRHGLPPLEPKTFWDVASAVKFLKRAQHRPPFLPRV